MSIATSHLVGRDSTLGVIDDLLSQATAGGSALLLEGAPGIGKTALLTHAAGAAAGRGLLVLATAGVQSESRLPFAALHRLVRPILMRADGLPAPQRNALLSAFGMAEAEAPAEFLIALATLDLLAEVASDAPLLIVVDDVQWIDAATAGVLAFVARRVESDPIVMLGAIREGADRPLLGAGLARRRLLPLDRASARTVLAEAAPALSPAEQARVLDTAEGNPLALVELPVAWQGAHDGTVVGDWVPLSERLERSFAARVGELPAVTQDLLLVSALNDGQGLAESMQATGSLVGRDVAIGELDPALSSLLVDVTGGEMRFRHPLIRSAIRQAAPMTKRHAAHAALARVLADQPDRSVWHRAASIVVPDEAVASELEAAGARAERRRGTAAATAALERAAELTPDPLRRGSRLLRAGAMAFALGRHDVVLRLLGQAEQLELDASARGRVLWLRELVQDRIAEPERVGTVVTVADDARLAGDPELALDILRTVATACWFSAPDEEPAKQAVAAAERLPVAADDPKLLAVLASAQPVGRGGDVIRRVAGRVPEDGDDPEALRQVAIALTAVGHFDQAEAYLAAVIPVLRTHGQLGLLAHALTLRTLGALHRGVAAVAVPAAEEAARLAREIGQSRLEGSVLLLAAHLEGRRGDQRAAESALDRSERLLGAVPPPALAGWTKTSRGGAALGTGNPEQAYEALRGLFDPSQPEDRPITRTLAFADFAEAALLTGHRTELQRVVTEMEALYVQLPSSLLRAGLAYARPLVADTRDAEARFKAELAGDLARWPFFRARLLAAYGTWLRRQRRVADSREPLRAARDAFDALGAPAWGERVQQELRAAGESDRRRAPYARDQITAQELQVAQMAAEGLSNREIGQRLYLSHRTVSSHLYRLFPKLGITSRSDLAAALDERGLLPG